MLKTIYLLIQLFKVIGILWGRFTETGFYTLGMFAFLITKQNRTMGEFWYSIVLIVSGGATALHNLDFWTKAESILGTIVSAIAITVSLFGLMVNRKIILGHLKEFLKDIEILKK